MRNKNLGESLTTVLAVIASTFTTISVIIPFFSGTYIDVIFVDPSVIKIISVFGFIIFLFSAFFTASVDFFIFLKGNFEKMKEYRFYSIVFIAFGILFLYGIKLAFFSEAIIREWASFLQMVFYITIYFFAGIATGTTVESMNSTIRGKQTQYEIYDAITQTLLKSNLLPLGFQILSINQLHQQVQNEAPINEEAHNVFIKINEDLYKFVFSANYDRILSLPLQFQNK